MEAIPASVVIIRGNHGWIAYVRYENRMLDQDIACLSRYILDSKIDYLFKGMPRNW